MRRVWIFGPVVAPMGDGNEEDWSASDQLERALDERLEANHTPKMGWRVLEAQTTMTTATRQKLTRGVGQSLGVVESEMLAVAMLTVVVESYERGY